MADCKKKNINKVIKKDSKIKKKVLPKENNEHYIFEDIVYFLLKGQIADGTYGSVSLDKWQFVSKYKWYLGKSGYPLCYELGQLQLHRFVYTIILGESIPYKFCVDHIDRNKLNNTNDNLRLATVQENSFNKTTNSNKKGVKKISKNNFSATIVKNGIKHEIKNIPSERQAAEMYNIMAEELFGTFASPNKLD